jgi:hypothetical protein
VALILAAAGLLYDAKTLLYAGLLFLALTIIAWLFFWAHPLPETIINEAGPEVLRAAEEAKERQERRKKLIDDARDFVARYEMQAQGTWLQAIRHSAAFGAIRPHLSDAYRRSLKSNRIVITGTEIHEVSVERFVEELDRLERTWGLS